MSCKPSPCPFCANKEVSLQAGMLDREGIPVNLVCDDCGARGPVEYSKPDACEDTQYLIAMAHWNARKRVR